MRIAAIQYINALPLIFGLKRDPSVELVLDTPSGCYNRLIQRSVDLALIPLIGTQTNSNIRALKGLGIAARNRTESVFVFARKPLDKIQTVTTDHGSLSSVMLLKIILQEKYRNTPLFRSESIDNIYEVLRREDAVLIIGNDAILAETTDYDHYDLATEWYSMTRLPFVFAVWASNGELDKHVKNLLTQSYKQSLEHPDELYANAQELLPVDIDFLKRYYNVNLHFQLTKKDYEGILKFLMLSAELRLLDKVRKDIWL
jgi:chorismate dehydratase